LTTPFNASEDQNLYARFSSPFSASADVNFVPPPVLSRASSSESKAEDDLTDLITLSTPRPYLPLISLSMAYNMWKRCSRFSFASADSWFVFVFLMLIESFLLIRFCHRPRECVVSFEFFRSSSNLKWVLKYAGRQINPALFRVAVITEFQMKVLTPTFAIATQLYEHWSTNQSYFASRDGYCMIRPPWGYKKPISTPVETKADEAEADEDEDQDDDFQEDSTASSFEPFVKSADVSASLWRTEFEVKNYWNYLSDSRSNDFLT
jgi:hypothetical protein